ncbi:MAG: phytanoyl-CoA dioxygenase family protein [Planctomycetales bacterium]
MPALNLTDEQSARFHADGFFVVESLLDGDEVELLRRIARADQALQGKAASRSDGEGGAVKLVVDNQLQDDMYGALVRSRSIVQAMQTLLNDEVYHYHHKMILKEPFVGGAWAWHQDYGYWYHNGCLAPEMASCLIAIDRATRANGCLQVVRGSHRLGRLDHGQVGDQTGVSDPERLQAVLDRHERIHCALEPGGAIFFHSNLLHRSDQNTSPDPRWAFIACYNTRGNNPYKESRHPRYTPLDLCDDSQVIDAGRRQWERLAALTHNAEPT